MESNLRKKLCQGRKQEKPERIHLNTVRTALNLPRNVYTEGGRKTVFIQSAFVEAVHGS